MTLAGFEPAILALLGASALPFSYVVSFRIRRSILAGDKVRNDISCSRQNVVIPAFARGMEQVSGFEPEIGGFADRRLGPLGYTRFSISDLRSWILDSTQENN